MAAKKEKHTIFSTKGVNTLFEKFVDSASLYFGMDSNFKRVKKSEKTFHNILTGCTIVVYIVIHDTSAVLKSRAKMLEKVLPGIFTLDVDVKWHIPYNRTNRTVTKRDFNCKIIYSTLKMTHSVCCSTSKLLNMNMKKTLLTSVWKPQLAVRG